MDDFDSTLDALERMATGCYVCKGPAGKDSVWIRTDGKTRRAAVCRACVNIGEVVECGRCKQSMHESDAPWYLVDINPQSGSDLVCRWCFEEMTGGESSEVKRLD